MLRTLATLAVLAHLAGCSPEPPLSPVGHDLRDRLHVVVSHGHEPLTYRELREALRITDADPDKPGNVIMFYTGWSRSGDLNGNDPSGWNREHV